MNTNGPKAAGLIISSGILVVGALICIKVLPSASVKPSTISVTGTATLQGAPDTLTFSVGATTTSPSATTALNENNTKMSAIEASLKSAGISNSNMQTSGLTIYSNTNNAGTVTGFSVSDSLNITTHKLGSAGKAIGAAATAAGNGVTLSDITFSISNESSILRKARIAAIKSANTDATDLTTAAHDTLGRVINITDQESQSVPPVFASGEAFTTTSASVPLKTGSESVTVTVSVVYAINK